ncbi:MAG: hypothetical protein H8F28_01055 [Fibrella sp.]|nr:hypothetical protein [Armatimonadota bacterium]
MTQREYDQTFTLTFIGLESVTVPAGTFNTALVNWGFTYSNAARNDQSAFQVEANVSSWFDATNGLVKSAMDSRSEAEFGGSGDEEPQTFETQVQTNTELISVK